MEWSSTLYNQSFFSFLMALTDNGGRLTKGGAAICAFSALLVFAITLAIATA